MLGEKDVEEQVQRCMAVWGHRRVSLFYDVPAGPGRNLVLMITAGLLGFTTLVMGGGGVVSVMSS